MQDRDQAAVNFQCDDLSVAFAQFLRQRTDAGTDLQDRRRGVATTQVRDFLNNGGVDQKILSVFFPKKPSPAGTAK